MTVSLHLASGRTDSFRQLADWALRQDPADLPADVRQRAALLVADNLVALLAAAGDDGVVKAQRAMRATGQGTDAPCAAAVETSIALSWMELDEGYARASCHVGLYALPVLDALARESGAEVRSVLGQLALVYEVLARLAAAFPARRFTWHPHAMWSPVGAALARCRAEGDDTEVALRSLRIASTLSMTGGYEAAIDGAEVRNLWAALGIRQGFAAVDLARAGIDGPAGAPEAIFARLTGHDPCDPALFTRGLGRDWAVFESFTKVHACCQSTHSAIAAALMLRRSGDVPLATIEAIEVATPRAEMANRHPANRLAAQFSLPHAVAAALALGHADAGAFAPERIGDPQIARLREMTTLVPWPAPLAAANARPATVRLRLADGRVLEQTCLDAAGMDADARRAAVRGKAAAYAGAVFLSAPGICDRLLEGDPGTLNRSWKDFTADWFRR